MELVCNSLTPYQSNGWCLFITVFCVSNSVCYTKGLIWMFLCIPDWKECDGRESRKRGHIEAMERLLQQVRATHQHYSCGGTNTPALTLHNTFSQRTHCHREEFKISSGEVLRQGSLSLDNQLRFTVNGKEKMCLINCVKKNLENMYFHHGKVYEETLLQTLLSENITQNHINHKLQGTNVYLGLKSAPQGFLFILQYLAKYIRAASSSWMSGSQLNVLKGNDF